MLLEQLSCKSGLERRAYDLCEMMPTSHAVQLAIKYATRLRRLQLAQQLSELAHQLAERETGGGEEEVDEWAMPQQRLDASLIKHSFKLNNTVAIYVQITFGY